VERPCGYARVTIGDAVVAVGRVVADTGWAGVFGMATLPGARGKGAARSVLAALADWAGHFLPMSSASKVSCADLITARSRSQPGSLTLTYRCIAPVGHRLPVTVMR
jgi:GNAT superfamily N-acetyltransferase